MGCIACFDITFHKETPRLKVTTTTTTATTATTIYGIRMLARSFLYSTFRLFSVFKRSKSKKFGEDFFENIFLRL